MNQPPRNAGEAGGSRPSGAASAVIGIGIFASRVAGLIRERVIATYFGTGLHADVFGAALRMPNLLQNLLGEGTLSASFIPVYSELLGRGRTQEAGRVAGAMFALLLAVAGLISLVGIVLAPVLVSVFAPGFEGERRELTIAVVRILFPMTGVLVLSAWALGILNSHRQFFVPYLAPVLWNAAIIAAFLVFGGQLELDALLMAAAWGALLGGILQFGIQVPWVLRLDREIRLTTGRAEPGFKEALRNAAPAIAGRGVVQLSTYVDLILASLLAIGAVARLRYAQTLYVLPVSLFGMSIAAAELPELARARGAASDVLRARTAAAVRRVAFFVVPSALAFILLGDVIVAGLYLAGEFARADVIIVWMVLAAYSLGLLASTSTRVYQSAFYALRDTKTPARIAGVRVLVAAVAGVLLMVQFEAIMIGSLALPAGAFADFNVAGIPLGPVGLALGAAVGAWIEWGLLRRELRRRVGTVGAGAWYLARTLAAALGASAVGFGLKLVLADLHPLATALLVAIGFGLAYFGIAHALRLDEARAVLDSMTRRIRGRAER